MMRIIEITDQQGALVDADCLSRCESVHRQLRPQLMPDYPGQMMQVCAGGGRMVVAVEGEIVLGLAVYRVLEKTFTRSELYIDDLVTDEARRSTGIGRALLGWCTARARERGCTQLTLDSGTQRHQAHKFYFREGLLLTSLHFVKSL